MEGKAGPRRRQPVTRLRGRRLLPSRLRGSLVVLRPRFAIVAIVAFVLTVALAAAPFDARRRRLRRAERTQAALADARTPTPFRDALAQVGCERVLVLPLNDFEHEEFMAIDGRPGSEVTLVWCEFEPGVTGAMCSSVQALLPSVTGRPPGGILFVGATAAHWKCQLQVGAHDELIADVRNDVRYSHTPGDTWHRKLKTIPRALKLKLCRTFDC
ncbi:MAG: hypothetical protein Q8L48_32415 [Archangium sp.]|nr:hypothetical protein [Archangium sp.]